MRDPCSAGKHAEYERRDERCAQPERKRSRVHANLVDLGRLVGAIRPQKLDT